VTFITSQRHMQAAERAPSVTPTTSTETVCQMEAAAWSNVQLQLISARHSRSTCATYEPYDSNRAVSCATHGVEACYPWEASARQPTRGLRVTLEHAILLQVLMKRLHEQRRTRCSSCSCHHASRKASRTANLSVGRQIFWSFVSCKNGRAFAFLIWY
jgi:hypothetical protein